MKRAKACADDYCNNIAKITVSDKDYSRMVYAVANRIATRYKRRQVERSSRESSRVPSRASVHPSDIQEEAEIAPSPKDEEVVMVSSSETTSPAGTTIAFHRPYPKELDNRVSSQRKRNSDLKHDGVSNIPDQGIDFDNGLPID